MSKWSATENRRRLGCKILALALLLWPASINAFELDFMGTLASRRGTLTLLQLAAPQPWGAHLGEVWIAGERYRMGGLDALLRSPCQPYAQIGLGLSLWDKRTNRLGTLWEFHLSFRWGHAFPWGSIFGQISHWSNAKAILKIPGVNGGEDFALAGYAWGF